MELLLDTGATLALEPTAVLVFVDETGHEELTQPRYPLFGLGGCVVRVAEYRSLIWEPWRALKRQHLSDADAALHANEVDPSDRALMESLGAFFKAQPFGRIASIVSDRTSLVGQLRPYDAVGVSLAARFAAVANWIRFTRVDWFFESSDRTDAIAEQLFGHLELKDRLPGGTDQDIPSGWHFLPKRLREPGLEVADFIMHAAGRRVRDRASGKKAGLDYCAVFESGDPRMASWIEITRARLQKRNPLMAAVHRARKARLRGPNKKSKRKRRAARKRRTR